MSVELWVPRRPRQLTYGDERPWFTLTGKERAAQGPQRLDRSGVQGVGGAPSFLEAEVCRVESQEGEDCRAEGLTPL